MDPRIAWFQPEQRGPANNLWMRIWETTQGFSYLHVNSCYTAGAPSTPSLKATVNGAPGAAVASRHGGFDTSTAPTPTSTAPTTGGEDGTRTMSTSAGSGVLAEQRDFIPLESNCNYNKRVPGRGSLGVGGEQQQQQQQGSGGSTLWRGVTDGHPNKRKRDNKASTFGFNTSLLTGSNTGSCDDYTGTPWKVRNYSEGVVG